MFKVTTLIRETYSDTNGENCPFVAKLLLAVTAWRHLWYKVMSFLQHYGFNFTHFKTSHKFSEGLKSRNKPKPCKALLSSFGPVLTRGPGETSIFFQKFSFIVQ